MEIEMVEPMVVKMAVELVDVSADLMAYEQAVSMVVTKA